MTKVTHLLKLCEDFDVPKAKKEVSDMSDKDIDTKSAYDWGARAIAAFQLVLELDDPLQKLEKYEAGDDFYHESKEHASLGNNPTQLVKEVIDQIEPYKEAAYQEIKALMAQGKLQK